MLDIGRGAGYFVLAGADTRAKAVASFEPELEGGSKRAFPSLSGMKTGRPNIEAIYQIILGL